MLTENGLVYLRGLTRDNDDLPYPLRQMVEKMNYWLIKSEPDAFSIDDLKNAPGKREHWDGIRNYQARNFMRDDMQKGDLAFFYHSNCKPPGIVGICEIVSDAYPDHTPSTRTKNTTTPRATRTTRAG